MLHWDLFSWKFKRFMLEQIFLMFSHSSLEGFPTQPWTPEIQQNIFYEVSLKHTLLSGAVGLNLLFKVKLGKTGWVLDHAALTAVEWRHSSGWTMGWKFGLAHLVAFSVINLIFLVHVDFRLFGQDCLMACDADRTEQDHTLIIPSQCHGNHGGICDSISEGREALLNFQNYILDLISFFFFPPVSWRLSCLRFWKKWEATSKEQRW